MFVSLHFLPRAFPYLTLHILFGRFPLLTFLIYALSTYLHL